MHLVSALVINLDARTDRWAYMQKTAQRLEITLERLAAVNGASLDLAKVPLPPIVRSTLKTGKKYSVLHLESRGAVGCFLSHREAWKRAATSSEPTLILEDDASPTEHAKKLLHMAWDQVRWGDWDMVLLGAHDGGSSELRPLVSWLETGVIKTGAWAYIVSPPAAQALLDKSTVLEFQVDPFLHSIGKRVGFVNAFQQASFFRGPDVKHFAIEPVPKRLIIIGIVIGAASMAVLSLCAWKLFSKKGC